jgi:hypothetical protein
MEFSLVLVQVPNLDTEMFQLVVVLCKAMAGYAVACARRLSKCERYKHVFSLPLFLLFVTNSKYKPSPRDFREDKSQWYLVILFLC